MVQHAGIQEAVGGSQVSCLVLKTPRNDLPHHMSSCIWLALGLAVVVDAQNGSEMTVWESSLEDVAFL